MTTHGQRTDVPNEYEPQPEGRAATPPSRDPDHPDAPGPDAAEETDLNPGAKARPRPPEGLSRP